MVATSVSRVLALGLALLLLGALLVIVQPAGLALARGTPEPEPVPVRPDSGIVPPEPPAAPNDVVTDTLAPAGTYTPVLTTGLPAAEIAPTLVVEQNLPPSPPALRAPPDGTAGVPLTPTLRVAVSDPDADDLAVAFYGRWVYTATAPPFAIVALPDTQYYSCGSLCGSDPAIFISQTQWIVDNRQDRNIAFVTHLGDVVEFGDVFPFEPHWQNADAAMSLLETPLQPAWPEGTPYGIAVGNHDQYFGTTWYNEYFGVERFQDRAYYGGHYGSNNNNHFELLSVGNLAFVHVHLEYDEAPDPAVLDWADQVLRTYPQRRAIVSSHFLLWPEGDFGDQGQAIYDALKDNPNLFLMLCGHHAEEARREDRYHGLPVHTLLSDYQERANGGDGWLRIMEFSPAGNEIQVRTYSPWLDQYETDANSEFVLPHTMDRSVFEVIAVNEGVPSGSETEAAWSGLSPGTQYEWYAVVGDGITATVGPLWTFTTEGIEEPVSGLAATSDSPTLLGYTTTLTATVTSGSHVTYTWAFGDGGVASGPVLAHVYPEARLYTAVVTAGNSLGQLTATTMVVVKWPASTSVYLPLLIRGY